MLWSFEKGTILTPQKQELSAAKHMSIADSMRRLSLIGIDVIWQLSLGVFIDEDHSKLPTLYGLPKLHKRSYKSRSIANSSSCTTTELSILLTSCLIAIKNNVIKYCTIFYERNCKKIFWSIINSGEILNKLKSRGLLALSLSTYDFSTLYTTLPQHLIKEKLTE